jgi:hypothetical protein
MRFMITGFWLGQRVCVSLWLQLSTLYLPETSFILFGEMGKL